MSLLRFPRLPIGELALTLNFLNILWLTHREMVLLYDGSAVYF